MGLLHSLAFPKQDERDKPRPLIIDVEEVLSEFAWNMYTHSYGPFRRRFIKRKNFTIEVPMNYYHFEQGQPKIKIRHSTKTRHPLTAEDGSARADGPREGRGTPEVIGLETRFNNDTDNDQKYNFSFQKERTAAMEITYQRGFSVGGKANFKLGLPKVNGEGEFGFEIETHVEVTKTTGERHEEKVTTSATSEITVAPNSHYVATVVMEERTLVADFEIPVTMTLPANRGLVNIRNRRTGEVVYVQNVTNLPFYFHKFSEVQIIDGDGNVTIDVSKGKDVRFKIVGIVNGVQLSSHCINLKQTGGSQNAGVSPKPNPRDMKGKVSRDDKRQQAAGGTTIPEVQSNSGMAQAADRNQTEAERVLQVAPSAQSSRMEGVMQFIAQQAKDSVSVHVPGGWFQDQ